MKTLLQVAVLALLPSCALFAPHVDSEAVDFHPLVEEHDAWVAADEDLTSDAALLALSESAALLDLLASGQALTVAQLAAQVEPVADRYDAYLLGEWSELTLFEQRYLSRTSDLARELAGLPLTPWPFPAVE